jgi:hypothetical protein
VFRIAYGKSSMVKHDLRPGSVFHKLKLRDRVNAGVPTARPPGLANTFIRHKLDLPPRDVPPKSENAPPASAPITGGLAPGGMPDFIAALSCTTLPNCLASVSAS